MLFNAFIKKKVKKILKSNTKNPKKSTIFQIDISQNSQFDYFFSAFLN